MYLERGRGGRVWAGVSLVRRCDDDEDDDDNMMMTMMMMIMMMVFTLQRSISLNNGCIVKLFAFGFRHPLQQIRPHHHCP